MGCNWCCGDSGWSERAQKASSSIPCSQSTLDTEHPPWPGRSSLPRYTCAPPGCRMVVMGLHYHPPDLREAVHVSNSPHDGQGVLPVILGQVGEWCALVEALPARVY